MQRQSDSGYSSISSAERILQDDCKHVSQNATPSPNICARQQMPTCFTCDGRQTIPSSSADLIVQELRTRAILDYVDLRQFCIEQNISLNSLELLIQMNTHGSFPRVVIDVDDRSYLCTDAFVENVKGAMQRAVFASNTDVVDLSSALADRVPPQMLIALAMEALNESTGDVRFMGDHVVWVRSCVTHSSEKTASDVHDARVREVLKQLSHEGFYIFHETDVANFDLEQGAVSSFLNENPHDAQPEVVYAVPYHAFSDIPSSKSKALVRAEVLQEELANIKLALTHRAELQWRDDSAPDDANDIVQQLEPADFRGPYRVELCDLLLRSEYVHDLEAVIRSRQAELERHRYDEFTNLIEMKLWCPLHLYAAGTMAVKDPILRKDLEDSALRKFRQETIPATIRAIREGNVLQDEQRASAIAFIESAMRNLNAFLDLQALVARVGRDLKIDPPHKELVRKVKRQNLEDNVHHMEITARGLEVFQGLLCVLLATSGPGLFVSSIKYTSRMIHQYDSQGGDAEVSGLLGLWWDKAREGLFDLEDTRQMHMIAEDAFEGWLQNSE